MTIVTGDPCVVRSSTTGAGAFSTAPEAPNPGARIPLCIEFAGGRGTCRAACLVVEVAGAVTQCLGRIGGNGGVRGAVCNNSSNSSTTVVGAPRELWGISSGGVAGPLKFGSLTTSVSHRCEFLLPCPILHNGKRRRL